MKKNVDEKKFGQQRLCDTKIFEFKKKIIEKKNVLQKKIS